MSDSPFSKASLDALVAQSLRESPPTISQPAEPVRTKGGGKWAMMGNVLGPLADGISTKWAIDQSGPNMQVRELNPLFGKNPSSNKILGIKAGQAAIQGLMSHFVGKKSPMVAKILGAMNAGVGGAMAVKNVRNGLAAKKANEGVKE